MEQASLQVENIVKDFPGVRALDNVSFVANEGEVLGLVGVNGAGKSTLMNLLGGLHQPDSGSIIIDDQQVTIANPREAEDLGIAFIQQEIQIFDSLRVFENIFISDLHKWRMGHGSPFIDNRILREKSKEYLEILGCEVDVNAQASNLVVGEKQMVQIARALCQGGRFLLFDEPTSSLSLKEKERLFEVIKRLRENGLVILYISHYLDEIFDICDRAVVLRDGCVTGGGYTSNLTKLSLVQAMIGREITAVERPPYSSIGPVLLDVEGLAGKTLPVDVSFNVHEGEILGIWGLMGSGRTELIQTLLGYERMTAGRIQYSEENELVDISPKRLAQRAGYLTESRHHDGLFLNMPLWQNITSVVLKRFASKFFGVLKRRSETKSAHEYMQKVNVKATSQDMYTYQLSGGNQQKVIIAKWLLKNPRLLLMDEPTKGVDIGAKTEIQKMIFERAANGMSFIIVSSELEEIMTLSHRIVVLQDGCLVAELQQDQITKDNLMDALAEEEPIND